MDYNLLEYSKTERYFIDNDSCRNKRIAILNEFIRFIDMFLVENSIYLICFEKVNIKETNYIFSLKSLNNRSLYIYQVNKGTEELESLIFYDSCSSNAIHTMVIGSALETIKKIPLIIEKEMNKKEKLSVSKCLRKVLDFIFSSKSPYFDYHITWVEFLVDNKGFVIATESDGAGIEVFYNDQTKHIFNDLVSRLSKSTELNIAPIWNM